MTTTLTKMNTEEYQDSMDEPCETLEEERFFGTKNLFRVKLVTDEQEQIFKSPWLEKAIKTLVSISTLDDNWDDDGAPSIQLGNILPAFKLLFEVSLAEAPEPHISPTLMGGVHIEWSTQKAGLEVEFMDEESMVVVFDKSDGSQEDWEQPISDNNFARLIDCINQL